MGSAKVFDAHDVQKHQILDAIQNQGCFILQNVLSNLFVEKAIPELVQAIHIDSQWHQSTAYSDYGMVLLCPLYQGIFWELLDNDLLLKPFEHVLGESCLIYAYTSSSMPPNQGNYSSRIHVDCPRIIPGYVTNLGATILLTDFTEQNGATYYLSGSQEVKEQPKEEFFLQNAHRVIAKAGSVFYFNARIWHSGGSNFTTNWRHAITMNMCRSFMRQRFDFPRALESKDTSKLSERARQKLGYYVQPPASYEEYYAPTHLRKFKQKVD